MLEILSDFCDSVLRRKGKYFLFFLQMILIFIIGQYTCHLAIKYVSFHQKLKQISEKKDKSYFAFQDQNSDNMPDCTLETYQKFRKEINELCNDTALSFGVSDIVLKSSKIPDKFISFKDTGKKYFQITYVTEHFLDYYHIKTKNGKVFSQKDYEDISSNLIPVLVGADYGEYIKKGQILDGKYKVIGVLEEGASYLDTELNSDVVSIDDQIVIPMIYQAKEWGGCYVNHLTFSINDNAVIEKITKKIRQYGFKDYEIHGMRKQIDDLKADFWTEVSFIMIMNGILSVFCIISIVSMLVHLIEERKTEYGIRMICGASRKDICINIMLPVAAIICTSSVPSIVLCNNLYEYLLQLIAILLMNGLVAAFPIMHWLKKPIQELKKER